MSTSILTVVLTSALLTGQNSTPVWLNDYGQAQRQGMEEKKPIAVVFGTGANGWSKVVQDAAPTDEVSQLLSDKYVCLYVDTSKAAGKKLAKSFEITGNVGLVISDRSGELQAFWHQGNLTNQNIVRYLEKYAAQQSVVTTETMNTTRTSFYPTSSISPNYSNYQVYPNQPVYSNYPSYSNSINYTDSQVYTNSYNSAPVYTGSPGYTRSSYQTGNPYSSGYCPTCGGGGRGRR